MEKLRGIQDVSILRHLLYRNERYLRRHYSRQQKTLLLRNGLDFKSIFCALETNKSRGDPISNKNDDDTSNEQLLRQYYLKRLSARASANNARNSTDNLVEAAARCYIEGFQWHITYLDLCAAKSATICQQYATRKKQQNNNNNCDMSTCETLFITTSKTNVEHYCHQTGDSIETNDILVTKLNQLNLNSHNTNTTSNNLPTITLTDFSEDSSDTNSVIFVNHEIIDQLRAPSIACHVEARPIADKIETA